MEKMEEKIEGWKESLLNQAGIESSKSRIHISLFGRTGKMKNIQQKRGTMQEKKKRKKKTQRQPLDKQLNGGIMARDIEYEGRRDQRTCSAIMRLDKSSVYISLKENIKSTGDWLQQMYRNGKTTDRTEVNQNWSIISIIMWSIWKAINMQIYNYIEPNPELVINQARKLELEYNSHTEEFNIKVMELSIRSKLKLNTDAAFSNVTKIGAAAAVIREHQGNVLGGTVNKITAGSTLSAEAQAIREAIILANNLGIQKATIESDNQLLVQTLKTGSTIWEVNPIIQDIRTIQRKMSNCGLPRRLMKETSWHTLAQLNHQNQLLNLSTTNPQPQVAHIIKREKLGIPHFSPIQSFLV
ncbi:hypothetical protein Ahy_A09g045883 [Arachis hypogaea]|uniref:RNase H type-1 domain-containing protein n=1 Tax=Arachis hypogaea TaxID=3818 RepID=A0A445BNE5_ARAHY|nr:hypothetical protein Ahy_A09g045883 [Arachis hypogaea]